jgi:phosphatidylglycerophosphate synthase
MVRNLETQNTLAVGRPGRPLPGSWSVDDLKEIRAKGGDRLADSTDRRPIPQRESGWARAIAGRLAGIGIRPNQVSVFSVVVSAGAFAALVFAGGAATAGVSAALFLAAVVLMEARLLCNLFDGMLAMEHGLKSPGGVLFNDVPDRISDALVLVGLGYAIQSWGWASDVGWLAALLAVGTAYVRLLGGASGVAQDFGGPMAKQLRVHVAAITSLGAAVSALFDGPTDQILLGGLVLVAAGALATNGARLLRISKALGRA